MMAEIDLDSETFARAIFSLVRDQSEEFQEAVLWFMDNAVSIGTMFEDQPKLSSEGFKKLAKEAVKRKDFILAILLCYKLALIENRNETSEKAARS